MYMTVVVGYAEKRLCSYIETYCCAAQLAPLQALGEDGLHVALVAIVAHVARAGACLGIAGSTSTAPSRSAPLVLIPWEDPALPRGAPAVDVEPAIPRQAPARATWATMATSATCRPSSPKACSGTSCAAQQYVSM